MAIRIEIKDNYVDDLISFYSLKQRSIREQIAGLENELRDVNATMAQLKQRPTSFKDSFSANLRTSQEVFSAKWPWLKKISYAIKEAGKPITTKEIIEILELYEPRTDDDRKSAISSVSSTLSVRSGKYPERKIFIKTVSDSGEFAYNLWEEEPVDEKESDRFGSSIAMDDLPF